MVSFTTICFTIAATAVASANAFTSPCRFPYDSCGWVLASATHGYTYDELQTAANSTNGSMIYDALYNCDSQTGEILYAGWCGGPGKCETGFVPNDNCRK